MIKTSLNEMMLVYHKLFNTILNLGVMPKKLVRWSYYRQFLNLANEVVPPSYRGIDLCFQLSALETVLFCFRACRFTWREGAPANRVTLPTELPWESQLLIRFFRKRIMRCLG